MNQPTGSPKQWILVVDDQELILSMLLKMLEFLGYRGVGVKSGEEAVKVFQSHLEQGNPFNAVIVDWIVPNGMNGKETFETLKRLDPTIKGILSSGMMVQEKNENEIDSNIGDVSMFSKLLAKPYSVKTVAATLEGVFGPDPLLG